jgi:hypothetical protein
MARRHGFLAAFALLALALGVLWSGGLSAATYSDPQGRFSFTVPKGWQNSLHSGGAISENDVEYQAPVANPVGGAPNFSIRTVPSRAAATSEDLLNEFLPMKGPDSQAIPGPQPTTLGGKSAVMAQYTAGSTRNEVIVVLSGDTYYVLTFMAGQADFAALLQQGAVILSSFAFAGASAAAPSAAAPSAAPVATTAPVTATPPVAAPPAAPRTGGFTAYFIRRLGDG